MAFAYGKIHQFYDRKRVWSSEVIAGGEVQIVTLRIHFRAVDLQTLDLLHGLSAAIDANAACCYKWRRGRSPEMEMLMTWV